MILQCISCKKVFPFAAKETEMSYRYSQTGLVDAETTSERHVCPYCDSKEIVEFVEPKQDIASVKSVALEEVDELLKQGYVVHELYARTATLKKLAAKEASQ